MTLRSTLRRGAFEDAWRPLPVAERCTLCFTRSRTASKHASTIFWRREVADTGKPAQIARQIDIPRGAANFRLFADLMKTAGTDFFEMDTPDGRGAFNYAVRAPHGVVGVIAPWNLPLLLLTWKVAPALASGNTVIAKPSEETPATATLLAEVMDAGRRSPLACSTLSTAFGPQFGWRMALSPPGDRCAHLHRRKQDRCGHHESRRRYREAALVRAGRQECGHHLRRCGFRRCRSRGTTRSVFRELRAGLPLFRARLCRAPPSSSASSQALKEQAEALVPADPWDDACTLGAAHLGRASHQGSRLLRSRHGRGRGNS